MGSPPAAQPLRPEPSKLIRTPSASRPAPFVVFHSRLAALSRQLRAALDGGADDVHHARVATRRIRELLPLLAPHQPAADRLEQGLGRIGRALGRVRHVDVTCEMAGVFERRCPDAAPALVGLRQDCVARRAELMRQAARTCEKVDVEGLIHVLGRCIPPAPPLDAPLLGDATWWQRTLRRALDRRARACLEAVEHCTGLYSQERAHRARITIRALRYTLEFAVDTGHDLGDAIGCLVSAQELLGELQDRQTLLAGLSAIGVERDACGSWDGIRRVAGFVSDENRALHATYLPLRGRIVAICQRQLNMNQMASPAPAPRARARTIHEGFQ